MPNYRWISETLHVPSGVRMDLRADKILCEIQTPHQSLALFVNKRFGKTLVLGGVTQITENDEFVYSEMMAHLPVFAHGAVQDVLIIGGGDCSIARQVLKHMVSRVTQVEIDASVVEFAQNYFPEFTRPVFGDSRFESIIADGMNFVAKTERRFDVIIVDSSDPEGPSEVLFSKRFYTGCRHCLKPGGILVTMNGVPFLQPKELTTSLRHFDKLFNHSGCFVASVPSYVGGHLAMGWASDMDIADVEVSVIAERYATAGSFETNYWTPRVHHAAFALPRYIAKLAQKTKP